MTAHIAPPAPHPSPHFNDPSRATQLRWPLIIVGLLAIHVTGMMWAIRVATHGPQAIVIPDYYAKSLHWDTDKADSDRFALLGFEAKLTTNGAADEHGDVPTLVQLSTRRDGDVRIESAELAFYHEAHADQVLTAALHGDGTPTPNGRYTQVLKLGRPGFYRFTLRLTTGGQTCTHQWTQYISPVVREEAMP